MPPLIKDRAIIADDWTYADAVDANTPGRVVLPLAAYVACAEVGEAGPNRAVLLTPEQHDLESLRPYVGALPLVVITFPNSGDGRGFSQATLLRERLGYKGELRARGRVMADQVWFMSRCGFDAFDIAEGEDPQLVMAQLNRFSVAYQPGSEGALSQPRMRRYGS
ncbi:MAG: DUF934 domain-containing protein [Nevskiaceae bacterium]|jgi:uncharacterized protein (DUF934 family)|nr:DUF934 domain-containing protein [Nevskiaceae bacterium]